MGRTLARVHWDSISAVATTISAVAGEAFLLAKRRRRRDGRRMRQSENDGRAGKTSRSRMGTSLVAALVAAILAGLAG